MSFAPAHSVHTSQSFPAIGDAESRAGFAVHLFLAAVVASLCGAWTELLTRQYGFPFNPTRVALLAGFAAIALRSGARGGPAQIWLAGLLAFFAAWGCIGHAVAIFPDWEVYQGMLLNLAVGTTIAFCAVWLPKNGNTLRCFGIYAAIGMTVMAVFFLPYVLTGSHPPGPRISSWHIHGGIARMPWTLDDPNMFASSLVVMLAVCFYCWEQTTSLRMRLFFVMGISSGCLLMLLSMSRAGVIGLAIGNAIYSLYQGRRRLAIYLVLGVVSICIAAATPVGEYAFARVLGQRDGGSSTSVRLKQYAYAVELGMEQPFGVGLGKSQELSEARVGYRIHSSVFEPFAELGLIGFALVSIGIILVLYRWMQVGRTTLTQAHLSTSLLPRSELRREWILITSTIVAMSFVAMTIPITNRTSLWFTIGLVAWYFAGFRRRMYEQQWLDYWQQQAEHQSERSAAQTPIQPRRTAA